ncbi:mucin-5AC-like isoform X3 [Haliotis rufescens]|uniref:mucin-5AC-like isoform X3 n=1 Tax=Haliotis rufescens TaxID=6454 RepID=UPI00201F50E0|nr:mucin-5AC-like isoform X3 [Haliotis rufescens]
MTFTFSSTTDQGAAWQCGKQVSDYDIHPRSNNYTIDVAGSVMSTQSLSTTTRHVDTTTPETVTTTKDVASSVMSTQSLSTTTRSVDVTSYPETVTPKKDVASSVMSTQSLSTTTRSMDITSYFETVTPDVASSAISTQSFSTATQSLTTTSSPETVTPKKDVSSSAMSTQSPPTATRSLATTSNPETVTPTKDGSNPDTLYIVVGVVAGVVLLIIVVVVIGCILWRRRAAHQHYDLKEGINVKSTPFSQNTSSNTVENDLYERSSNVPPINAAANQEEDFILSDAYASVDMPMENTCTPQEQVSSGGDDLENLYAKPNKGKP